MLNSNAWLQQAANRLAASAFVALPAAIYQPQGYKYAVRRTRFEITKFGMAETFFTFAEIPNLTAETLYRYSNAAYRFAISNKAVPLPCGLFESVFCFPVAVTAHLHPQLADYIRQTEPVKHWSAAEIPVIFDLSNGGLYCFERTPIWGGAYYAGFRREIQQFLR
jgi:hypothetical protein